jgi:hypothetical protein
MPVSVLETIGVVEDVDPGARRLWVRAEGTVLELTVPPESEILLNEEPIEFAGLRPRDDVHVVYTGSPGGLFAHHLHVRWWFPLFSPDRGPSPPQRLPSLAARGVCPVLEPMITGLGSR